MNGRTFLISSGIVGIGALVSNSHGRRVIKDSRLLLDFRNSEVRSYLDSVVERPVKEYGIGYIKMDVFWHLPSSQSCKVV